MIHEEDEEEEPAILDFSWYRFIAQAKLGLSFREVGRLTLGMFNRMWQHYKDNFDLELRLRWSGVTYEALRTQTDESEEWL